MDRQFIQLIGDVTKDTWNLSTQQKAIEIQKDSDFLQNIKFMPIRTKVHMLLQFAILSPEYIQNHKTMITDIVNVCINDKDRWVSEIAKTLLKSYGTESTTQSFLSQDEENRMRRIVKDTANNSLFSTSLPFSLQPKQFTFGKWKESLEQSTIQKDTVKLRESTQPQVKGLVGIVRKRSQPTPTPKVTIQHEEKKIRVSTSSIKIKPKIKVSGSSESKPVVKSSTAEVTLPKRFPVGSDQPFVPLSFDSTVAAKLRLKCAMCKESMEVEKAVPSNDHLFCFAGLFVNILRKLGYDGIQNEVCDSVASFMKGQVPDMKWNNEEQAVDYVVSVDDKNRKINVLRLFFNDFSWELIEELY